MLITEAVFSAVFNILSIYVAFRMVKLILSRKEEMVVPPVVVYFCVWSINWLIFYFFNNVIFTMGSLAFGMLIATILLYEGTMVKKLLSVISALALGVVSENIIWILFGGLDVLQINMALGSLFSSFLNMFIILLLEKCMQIKKAEHVSSKSYLNIVIIIVGSIVLGEILVELGGNDQSLVMVGLSIICIIDVSTYYIYDKINEAYLQRLEREAIKQKVEMYEHQLDLMEQSHKNIKALRHDMKKHLYLIQSYLDDNETDKAQQYIDNINEHMVIPVQHIHTGNQEIDAIMNYMFDRAIRMDCKIETQIEVPNIGFMDKMDLNIILGNLLDNALEALEQTSERQLSVNMKYKKGVFVVKISNFYDGTLIKCNDNYITRKKDTENHGLGLQNVSQVIEKYNGEMQIDTTSDMFKISVILYVEAVQE